MSIPDPAPRAAEPARSPLPLVGTSIPPGRADEPAVNPRHVLAVEAVDLLGPLLAHYVTGDLSFAALAELLACSVWGNLDDDFGPAVRDLDTAHALRNFADELLATARTFNVHLVRS